MSLGSIEIQALANDWPWSYDRVDLAAERADARGWTIPQLVGFLDALAGFAPDADPADAVLTIRRPEILG